MSRGGSGWHVIVSVLDDMQLILVGWNRSLLRTRGQRPPQVGHYEGISYTTTADRLAQVERFYSMAAMAKLERCPDCIAAGAPPDAAQVTTIPGCGPSSQGSDPILLPTLWMPPHVSDHT